MKKYLYIIGHLLFWTAICYAFTHYSYLRPITIDAMYKEYWSVLFIAIMVYINYFYLIPRFFETGKLKTYWLFALLSIVLVVVGEILLVYPDIKIFYARTVLPEYMDHTLRTAYILIAIRDFCFFLFFFILKLYRDLLGKYISLQKRYSEDTDTIDITAITPTNYRDIRNINISNIVYIAQNRNYSYFHLVDGDILKQYSTMASLEETLPQYFVKINKSQLININQVVDFKDDKVKMNFKENGEYLSLSISKKIEHHVFWMLEESAERFARSDSDVESGEMNFCGASNLLNDDECGVSEQKLSKIDPVSNESLLEKSQISEKPTLYSTVEKTLAFIKKHPHNRVPVIAEGVSLSRRAVEEHIKILKKHGLVEYRGGDRTGGYFAVKEKV